MRTGWVPMLRAAAKVQTPGLSAAVSGSPGQTSALSASCSVPARGDLVASCPCPSPTRPSCPHTPQVHGVALSEQDLQREIRTQLAQLPPSASGPPPRPQDRLPGAQAVFQAQQLAGLCPDAKKPEVPLIVVQPPEEPRRKPQTRGKTFHGLLTRARGPPIQGSPRSHRGSTSFLDTRF